MTLIEILSEDMHKNATEHEWYWQFVVKYRRPGYTRSKNIVINAYRWDQASKDYRESAVQRLNNGETDDEFKVYYFEKMEKDENDNLWVITSYPGAWGVPYIGQEESIKEWMKTIAGDMLEQFQSGHRNWFTQRIVAR